MSEKCFACGGSFEPVEGPTHKYMLSSSGCWKAYGELLAREYENPMLFGAVHRLTVDAYALQHPGDPSDRRARQSVWVHCRPSFGPSKNGRSIENSVDYAEANRWYLPDVAASSHEIRSHA